MTTVVIFFVLLLKLPDHVKSYVKDLEEKEDETLLYGKLGSV